MKERAKAMTVLAASTVAFTGCFAAWTLYGVLATFLVEKGAFAWTRGEMGLLIGIPVLTGSLMRLPVGILCDQFGGRLVFFLLMLAAAVPMFLVSFADRYGAFVLAGLGFGVAGASFAAGVAYTATWFTKERIGFALGVFGMGNSGAALTAMLAPMLLRRLTASNLEGWRTLPKLYAGLLVAMAALFWSLTYHRMPPGETRVTLLQRLAPLRHTRVWRFGFYYAFFFGGFVSLSQWLIPYYVNVYTLSVGTAGFLAAFFSLPSGIIRAAGGWMSDRWGARAVMYGTLSPAVMLCVLLFPAAMIIHTPGEGIVAGEPASVVRVSSSQIVLTTGTVYRLKEPKDPAALLDFTTDRHLVLPSTVRWQEPVVMAGQQVAKGDLLARGTTRIFFQANQWVFTILVFLLGCTMGIGMAAVYKHIPAYFPNEVGVVGGLVGVLGGLGGFVFPIVFGYLLQATGLWTTCWMFLTVLAVISLFWMHLVVRRLMREQAPGLMRTVEAPLP